MNLGPRLKELRTTKGIIQGDLGEIVGVKTSEISGYEIGTRNPSYAVLIKLADYFNVTADYLIGRGEKQMTNKEKMDLVISKLLDQVNESLDKEGAINASTLTALQVLTQLTSLNNSLG